MMQTSSVVKHNAVPCLL